jgi:hypothetical protein
MANPSTASIQTSMAIQSRLSMPIQFSHQIHTSLNQENHLLRKSQILPILRGHGLVGFIDGSKPQLEQFLTKNEVQSPNPDYEAWQQ